MNDVMKPDAMALPRCSVDSCPLWGGDHHHEKPIPTEALLRDGRGWDVNDLLSTAQARFREVCTLIITAHDEAGGTGETRKALFPHFTDFGDWLATLSVVLRDGAALELLRYGRVDQLLEKAKAQLRVNPPPRTQEALLLRNAFTIVRTVAEEKGADADWLEGLDNIERAALP